jgi:hypothetical protein
MVMRQSLRDNQQHPAVAPCPLPVSFVAVVADFFPPSSLSQKAPLLGSYKAQNIYEPTFMILRNSTRLQPTDLYL